MFWVGDKPATRIAVFIAKLDFEKEVVTTAISAHLFGAQVPIARPEAFGPPSGVSRKKPMRFMLEPGDPRRQWRGFSTAAGQFRPDRVAGPCLSEARRADHLAVRGSSTLNAPFLSTADAKYPAKTSRCHRVGSGSGPE